MLALIKAVLWLLILAIHQKLLPCAQGLISKIYWIAAANIVKLDLC